MLARSRTIYIRGITANSVLIWLQGVLSFLVKLAKMAQAANTLGITHLDYTSFLMFFETEMLLMVEAADASIKYYHEAYRFRDNAFYR